MSLFDPADFPSANDNKYARAKRSKPKPRVSTPSNGRWYVIAQILGPIPFCHRLDPSVSSSEGSVVTRCEIVGRLLFCPDVGTPIFECPECKLRAT